MKCPGKRTLVLALLMGGFLLADTGFAREMRSVAERRQRPGLGLWAKPSSTSSSSSRGWSWFGSHRSNTSHGHYSAPHQRNHYSEPPVIHQSRPLPGSVNHPPTAAPVHGGHQTSHGAPHPSPPMHAAPPAQAIGSPVICKPQVMP